jgi:ADP-heptose:LPS heptosyltransferase
MDKIILFHMNQLGDLLFSLPILQAIKNQYPKIKLYSVVKPNLVELLESTKLVDKIFIKEKSFFKRLKLIGEIKKENINTALLFSESPDTLITAFCSNIKHRVGFKTSSFNFLLTDKADKIGVPSLLNNVNLAKKLGIENIKTDYTDIIKINEENNNNVDKWLKENNLKEKDFIVISIGASPRRQNKCLNNEVWVETINKLHLLNKKVVVAGAKWEKEYIETIVNKCEHIPQIYLPKNGLADMAGFIKKANFFIGVDSGLMHLSASLGIRCIALYGNTDPIQVGPQPLNKHIIIKKNSTKDIDSNDIIEKIQNLSHKVY